MQPIQIVKIQMIKEKNLMVESKKLSSPKATYEIAKKYLEFADKEHLVLLTLDTKNKITSISTVSVGSLNLSIVHPREVFKTAILANAASIILVHNHPSGDPNPSNEDISITKRIKECSEMLGIELLDHVIIGDEDFISLRVKGII